MPPCAPLLRAAVCQAPGQESLRQLPENKPPPFLTLVNSATSLRYRKSGECECATITQKKKYPGRSKSQVCPGFLVTPNRSRAGGPSHTVPPAAGTSGHSHCPSAAPPLLACPATPTRPLRPHSRAPSSGKPFLIPAGGTADLWSALPLGQCVSCVSSTPDQHSTVGPQHPHVPDEDPELQEGC